MDLSNNQQMNIPQRLSLRVRAVCRFWDAVAVVSSGGSHENDGGEE